METYGVMADIHLHCWDQFAMVDKDGVNSRLKDGLNEMKRCARMVHEAGGSMVHVCGDLFHKRGVLYPHVVNPLIQTLEECNREYNVTFSFIAGNHDLQGDESNNLNSSLTFLLPNRNVRIENYPRLNGLNHLHIPWIEDIEKLKNILEKYKHPDRVVFGHFGINGSLNGQAGVGLDPEWLKSLKYKFMFFGHWHNYKDFGGGVFQVGTPNHHTWKDVDTHSGFIIVKDDVPKWYASHAPRFMRLTGKEDELELPFLIDGHFVEASFDAATPQELEEYKKALLDNGAKGAIVHNLRAQTVARTGYKAAQLNRLDKSVADYCDDSKQGDDVKNGALKILEEVTK